MCAMENTTDMKGKIVSFVSCSLQTYKKLIQASKGTVNWNKITAKE